MTIQKKHVDTIAVQGTYNPKNGEPRVVPLYQSTTFAYEKAEDITDLFDLKTAGFFYSRVSNPTVATFEEKIAALDGGVGAVATASGMAAISNAILTIANNGDNILCAKAVYGGTYNLFNTTLPKLGITTQFFDQKVSSEKIIALADENTKLIFLETISNPSIEVIDFHKFSTISQQLGIPLVVDNSLVGPTLCQPLKYGADIVIYSSSKYLDGHASAVGGVVVDSGRFNWGNGRFPDLVNPDASYHGLSYVSDFGALAYLTKLRVQYIRDLGAPLSPFNAYLSNLGVETLHLRAERHSQNALTIANWLQNRTGVEFVHYPGLNTDSQHNLAEKYLPHGASGIISFGVIGGKTEARKFINQLELIRLVVHCADTRSSVIHPASSTHRQLTTEELVAGGVTENLIRLSVGIEQVNDLIDDLDKGFSAIGY